MKKRQGRNAGLEISKAKKLKALETPQNPRNDNICSLEAVPMALESFQLSATAMAITILCVSPLMGLWTDKVGKWSKATIPCQQQRKKKGTSIGNPLRHCSLLYYTQTHRLSL